MRNQYWVIEIPQMVSQISAVPINSWPTNYEKV